MTIYTITLTNGTVLTTIPPQTVDTSHTSINLIGQGTENYGAYLNNDLVHIIEHFANTTPPPHPLVGQLWYNTTLAQHLVWTGSAWANIPAQQPPNDAAVVPALVGTNPSILAFLCAGKVLGAMADRFIANGTLPSTITYRGTVYAFASQFPNGINTGITISSIIELSPSDNSDTLVTSKWVKQQGYLSSLTSGQIISILGYTPLDPDDNLAELTSPSVARTNLGLGSMAVQNSSAISVTGGSLTGVSISGTSATFASLTLTGTELASYVFAAPTGSTGAPTWRQLVAADVSGVEIQTNKGVANGYASLDGTGHVPLAQIPAIAGGVVFKGTWNASGNNPTLTSGVGTQGWMYVVSIAGNTNLDGNTGWQVGDYAIFNGTAWQRVPNSVPVTSVAGRTGNIVLTITDISGGAPIASPNFSGNPIAPTAATSDNSQTLATTAFVKNQNYLTTNDVVTISGVVQGSGATSISLNYTPTAANTVIANVSDVSASPAAVSVTALFDGLLGNTQGNVIYRDASTWSVLAPGTSGQYLQTQGSAANPVWAGAVASFNSRTGAITLTSSDITTALGFSPLSANQTVTLSGAINGSGTTAITTTYSNIANNNLLANTSGIIGPPIATSLSTLLDSVIDNTHGDFIYRGASSWTSLPAGTAGQVLQTNGNAANPQWTSVPTSFNTRTGAITLTSGDVTTALGYTPLSTNQTITVSGAVTGSGTTSISTAFAAIGSKTVLSNVTGGSAVPTANSISSILDTIDNTQGDLLYRNASNWTILTPGTSGQFLQTLGAAANPQWASAVTSVATGTGLSGGPITSTGTISLASIASNTLLANTTLSSAAPIATTVSALLDSTVGNVQGDILYRGASTWGVLTPGTKGQMLQTQGSAANPVWGNESVVANFLRLKGNAAGGTKTASWTADQVIAQTALAGVSYKGTSLSLSFNGATTGAGGMDTGATPTSGNLAVYAIYNPTSNTWNTLGYAPGVSTVAATIYPGANMPSGYTASCLLWVGVTDGSGNVQLFHQAQRRIFVNTVQVLSADAVSPNTYATLSLTTIVPPDAVEVFGIMGGTLTNQNIELAIAADTSGTAVSYYHSGNPGAGLLDGMAGSGSFGPIPLITAQQVAWKSANTAQTNVIKIRGYDF